MIRLATLADISTLNKMIALSVRGLSIGHYTTVEIESALKYIFGVDTQLVADKTYYVAEIDGEIAGYGGWSKRSTLYGGDQAKDVSENLLDPAKDAAKIRAFFVHPAFARSGIGRALINICEKAALDQGFTRLELGATMPGVPLYEAMGYLKGDYINAILPDGVELKIMNMTKQLVGHL